MVELTLFVLIVTGGISAAFFLESGSRRLLSSVFLLSLVLLIYSITAAAVWDRRNRLKMDSFESLEEAAPERGAVEEFVTSQTCQSCHPFQYDSWHQSYHRTMTQLALPGNVIGDFDDVRLESRGRTYHLSRKGDEYWVNMVDPIFDRELKRVGIEPEDYQGEAPRIDSRVLLTTGSHHQQTYWVGSRHGAYFNFPWIHLKEEDRWIPREDAFLAPPDAPRMFGLWNSNCVRCHTTSHIPGADFQNEVWNTRLAELGISCEACHGPAEEHVRVNRNPARRYLYRLTANSDPTIVNPSKLDHKKSSEVCGQCHTVFHHLSGNDYWENGFPFRPGGDLHESRLVIIPEKNRDHPSLEAAAKEDPDWERGSFWSDSVVRVSGREFNAMSESACYLNGEISCLSCHSMHESDPDDQLAAGMATDKACTQCHAPEQYQAEAHTRHPLHSESSRCYNCHMPYTTYGLLKAIRSHHIENPSVATHLETGRPNACNLCHLDQTLEWTAERLTEWYGQPETTVPEEHQRTAASVLGALTGDAGLRAIWAWNMGWAPAQEASGRDWLAPYLAQLLQDPYSAVRFVAKRSLQGLPGYSNFEYDYLRHSEYLRDAKLRALKVWEAQEIQQVDSGAAAESHMAPRVLLKPDGRMDWNDFNELLARRDDTPINLRE